MAALGGGHQAASVADTDQDRVLLGRVIIAAKQKRRQLDQPGQSAAIRGSAWTLGSPFCNLFSVSVAPEAHSGKTSPVSALSTLPGFFYAPGRPDQGIWPAGRPIATRMCQPATSGLTW